MVGKHYLEGIAKLRAPSTRTAVKPEEETVAAPGPPVERTWEGGRMAAPAEMATAKEVHERKQEDLKEAHMGWYVVCDDGELADVFDEADQANTAALERFSVGCCLVCRIGARLEIRLPASLTLGQNRVHP